MWGLVGGTLVSSHTYWDPNRVPIDYYFYYIKYWAGLLKQATIVLICAAIVQFAPPRAIIAQESTKILYFEHRNTKLLQ